MQALRQLSRQQQEEFLKIKNSQNGMDQHTFDLCLKYFVQYKHSAGNLSPQKLTIAFKTALFMAEKSQNIQNLKGQRIFLPSITLGQVLKTHQVDQFMITLKDFSKHVKITDKEAAADMVNLIREISFLITFHKKFDKSIERLELKERQPESSGTDYLKNWSSFAWLLYIQIKNKAFHKTLDLIENTCLLAHTIAFMLVWAWQYIVPKGILKNEFKINEQSSCKEVMSVLRDRVLEMFSIKTMDMYASIASKFQNFFELELEKKGVVKSNSNNYPSDFLSPDLLPQNYRRLDKLYQRSLGPNDLDERIFFRERLANLTPSKFTPFARQGYANKGRKLNQNDNNSLKQNFSSHRILNYQLIDKQQISTKTINQGINISKLPKTVLASPSTMKVQLICQTPITMGMQMFNYVNEKNRKFKELLNQGQVINRPFEGEVVKHIQIIYEKGKKDFDRKTKQIRQDIIFSLFKLVLEEYLSQYPSQKDNIQIYQALMALSMQVVLFVCNSTLAFQDVEKEVNTSPFQLWKACHFFLKFDKSMPSALKLHLLDLEVSLISYKLWLDPQNLQIITRLSKGIEQKENDSIRGEFADKLFRRVLHQIAYMINQLGCALKLDDSSTENIFELMKTVYTQHAYLLENRNIDQLIMCCIFALNKIQKLDLRFTDIIEVYKEVNQYNKDLHDSIIMQIAGKDKEFINLITFYNDFFAKSKVKEVIINFKNNYCENKKRVGYNAILQSPLKDILPRQLNKKNGKKATKDGNTNLLISVTDSPLLKHQPLSFKAGIVPKTKKIIDFDQEERQYLKQDKLKEQEKSPRTVNTLNNAPQLNKKNLQMQQNSFGNYPWKTITQGQQQGMNMNINGLTPTRISKNLSNQNNHQLNSFNSNSGPMITKPSSNMPLKMQQIITSNFSKPASRMNFQ